jgi:hypothetical protein
MEQHYASAQGCPGGRHEDGHEAEPPTTTRTNLPRVGRLWRSCKASPGATASVASTPVIVSLW